MIEEKKAPIKTRETLKITDASEPQAIGEKGYMKLAITANNKKYFTFSKRLFPLLKAGETVEVDVESTVRETQYGTFRDSKITEVYVDGKPAGGQGGGYRKEDKEFKADPVKMLSIEQQTAFKGVIELLAAKVLALNDSLSILALDWAQKMLSPAPTTSAKTSPDAPGSGKTAVKGLPDTFDRPDMEAMLFTQCNVLIITKVWNKLQLRGILQKLGGTGETVKAAIASLSDENLLAFQSIVLEGITVKEGKK